MTKPKDLTILIVDDEAGLRKALRFDFKRGGFNVLDAACGKDAFEIVKTQKVDVVLTDVRMPNGDGIELLDNIKAMNPDVPVVMFITGFADISMEDAYNKGADAVFAKPFDRKKLLAAVKKATADDAEKWAARTAERFDVSFMIELSFPDLQFSVQGKVLNLGRGGMFVALDNKFPALDEDVSFKIKFDQGAPKGLDGNGVVRWVRGKPHEGQKSGCGIEFEYLSDDSRREIVDLVGKLKTKAFIPKT